jgi:hypothetical protein
LRTGDYNTFSLTPTAEIKRTRLSNTAIQELRQLDDAGIHVLFEILKISRRKSDVHVLPFSLMDICVASIE